MHVATTRRHYVGRDGQERVYETHLLRRSYRLMEELIADQELKATGDPREVYVSDPTEVTSPAELETLIVWPIRPDDKLDPPRDYFKRRVEID